MWKFSDESRSITIKYRLTEDYNGDLGAATYGVEAEMLMRGAEPERASVKDAFCTRLEAELFIELLAYNGVEPCHLQDVIVDTLSR